MKKIVLICAALVVIISCSKDDNNKTSKTVTKSNPSPVSVDNVGPITPSQTTAQHSGNTIVSYNSIEAQNLIKNQKDLLIVDVRSPQELKEGKIKNSVLVPFWSVMKNQHNIPRNKPLLLVCAVGGRSYAAMQILARQGYSEIYNLKGGISAWKKSKLPLVY